MAQGRATHASIIATSTVAVGILCDLVKARKDSFGFFEVNKVADRYLEDKGINIHEHLEAFEKYGLLEWGGQDNKRKHRLTSLVDPTLDDLGIIFKNAKQKWNDPRKDEPPVPAIAARAAREAPAVGDGDEDETAADAADIIREERGPGEVDDEDDGIVKEPVDPEPSSRKSAPQAPKARKPKSFAKKD